VLARSCLVLLSGLVALAGCSSLPFLSKESATDPDSRRDKAEVIAIGGSAKDSLNVKESDSADWKAIELSEEGKLRVVVTFGNRSCFCQVELYDPAGKKLATHKDIDSRPRIDLVVDKATPGRYLLRFSARYEGDFSGYLVEPVFRASARPTPVEVATEPEEPTEPKESPETTPAVAEAPGLSAKITKSKPGSPGFLVLTLNKGSDDGLAEGDQGLIDGLEGGELRVIKVEKKSAQAETAVTAKTLKGHSTVTIKVKK
jgi:hypothetical protein